VRETALGHCSGCNLEPDALVMLPDGMLAIASTDGWYLVNPPGID
jgi:hypothetical protein